MTDYRFSKRIETIAEFINKNCTVADIGTDHGYLPLYLLLNNYDVNIIAADVRKAPLEKAKRNAREAGVADRITFVLSDGLSNIDDKVDSFVICGMGGYVIMHILEEAIESGRDMLGAEFVISPHSDEKALREFLYRKGFRIEDERLIHDKDFFYTIIHCVYDGVERSESETVYSYGKEPLEDKQSALEDYLAREKRILTEVLEKLEAVGSDKAADKAGEIRHRLQINEEARELIQ